MPDKPFFVYFAPGATHAPHHVPPEWSDKYKGRFDQGWDALREETLARQKALGVVPADAELTARPGRDPGLGRHARRPEAGARAPDGGLRRASSSTPTTTSGGSIDALADLEILDDTLVYYDHRRQRRLGRGHAERLLQRARRPQRRGRARDDRVHGLADRRLRHARGLQPLRGRLGARDGHAVPVDEAGRLALGRHPQRHDRPLAERASRPGARSARSSTT